MSSHKKEHLDEIFGIFLKVSEEVGYIRDWNK
jgi:hypothetical protein